jgi:DNA-binding transcriptional ArsR family regulator
MGNEREGLDPDDAFAALSDPTRVEIVRELAAEFREDRENPVLGFADLRKRVGVRDSGRFRYHLKELCGHFVEDVEDGYRLSAAGVEVATAIAAGSFTDRVRLGPTELDSECPDCETPAVGTFEDRRIEVTCGNDHRLLTWGLPPNAAAGASVPELVELATMQVRHRTESVLRGTCPACGGGIDGRAVPADPSTGSTARVEAVCDDCGSVLDAGLWTTLLAHPPVVAFLQEHGVSVAETYYWEFPIEGVEAPFPDGSEVPYHFRVDAGGRRLHAAVDERGRVVRTVRRDRD